MLPVDMRELLSRQVDLLRTAISDLRDLEQELPSYRRGEIASVVGRLLAALADDCAALTALGDGPFTTTDHACQSIAELGEAEKLVDGDARLRRDRRLGEMLDSRPPKLS